MAGKTGCAGAAGGMGILSGAVDGNSGALSTPGAISLGTLAVAALAVVSRGGFTDFAADAGGGAGVSGGTTGGAGGGRISAVRGDDASCPPPKSSTSVPNNAAT